MTLKKKRQTVTFKSLGFIRFKKHEYFFQQGCITLIKSDSKEMYIMIQKIYISNKFCSFALSIHPEKEH